MDKILTITIPSYNTEKFMDTILTKLTSTKQVSLLDIIVVDDGSKDKTAIQAEKFQTRFPESVRVISKVNGGHGSAINTGMHNAVGKYFKVVDADDWLDPNLLDEFIDVLKEENTDLVFTPFKTIDAKSKKIKLKQIKQENLDWNKEYDLNQNELTKLPSIHCYTIKTNILKKENIVIDEHAYYVDVEYILYPLLAVNNFKYVNLPMYYYQINQTGQSISISNMMKNKNRHEFVLTRVNEFMNGKLKELSINKRKIIVTRISQMVAAQYKIIVIFPISINVYKELKRFEYKVNQNFVFDITSVNLPIRFLVKSKFLLFPMIHYLAVLKMKIVHV